MSDAARRPRGSAWVWPGLGLLAGYALGLPRRAQVTATTPALSPEPRAARAAVEPFLEPGAEGAGGFRAAWPKGSRDARLAPHIGFQYAGIEHQTETAISGMWLFLATELLFFGGLFLLYAVYRGMHPEAIAEASRHAELIIGTANTVLLLTSSAVFSYGLGCAQRGRNGALFWACVAVAAIGLLFLGLKGYEWMDDLRKNLFPGAGFSIGGPDSGIAQLFWSFYFVATGLHGLHMIVGIGLVAWIARGARAGRFSAAHHVPVEVVGLYWSFVDMVWLVLYPTIYLAGGIGR